MACHISKAVTPIRLDILARLRFSGLLGRTALALASVAALPLFLSFYQLRTNRDALLEQVQRTHLVAATTTSARIEARLEALRTLASSLAGNPFVYEEPKSAPAQELLRGTVVSRDDLAALGIFLSSGDTVVLATKGEFKEEIVPVLLPPFTKALETVVGASSRLWIRLRIALPGGRAHLVLVAAIDAIEEVVTSPELGREAELLLANRSGRVIFGAKDLRDLPKSVVDLASSQALASGAQKIRFDDREDLVVAYSQVAGTDWFVIAQQPSRIAELAVTRIRQATGVAVAGSVSLTLLLSLVAWSTVVKPLRELLVAQRQLAGIPGPLPSGSEIEQLRSSFDELERRVRDRTELGDVFLGRYQVVDVLGTGAMGSVFRGWDPRLKRSLAIKTVRLSGVVFDRDRLTRQLMEEAEIYARFNHPNIITVHDVAGTESAAFVVMELVDGASLEAYLEDHGRLSSDQVVPLGAAIAQALSVAHELGVVHHDVKPANVLLGRDGTIKVGDFGISRMVSQALEGKGVVCGTPGYLPPESLEKAIFTEKSDLFALGVVLFKCLTGESPFPGQTVDEIVLNTVKGRRRSLRKLAPDAPAALTALIADMLLSSPDRRPASARKIAERLDQLTKERGYTWKAEIAESEQPHPAQSQSQLIPIRPSQQH